ncbi:hypothetical protein WJX73_005063 [Symbiochloris irregularis]|uniref:Tafazzin family protein n=1 Tax=Symbiochloris irregularis TaxID=706552 RepID=A0AAW1Q3S2_9CHLO
MTRPDADQLVLKVLNTTEVRNGQSLLEAVEHRDPEVGLVTVCNHTSTIDDPFVIATLLPVRFLWQERLHHKTRWSLCAKEICFQNAVLEQFFRSGKVMPIERGQGLHQQAMRVAGARAAIGDWVHLFPEGKVIYGGSLGRCKWGVGKVVCDCVNKSGRAPVVLPFFHSGMGHVMPKGSVVPSVGKHVTVTVGQPLDVSDLTPLCGAKAEDDQHKAWRSITERIASALQELEARTPPNRVQIEGHGKPAAPGQQQPPLEPHPTA